MNKNIKTICLTALMMVSFTISAKGTSTILLSQEKQGFTFDFLNENEVTGLQFDVVMKGVNQKSTSLSGCVSGLAKTHIGACKFVKNGNLRVIIFSPTNAILESGNLGFINTQSEIKNLKITKVTMVRPDLKEIKGDILIDVDRTLLNERESLK